MDQLQKFHAQKGNNLNKFPSVDKRPLDLFKLKKSVDLRGGFEKVCMMKKWAEIGRDLGYSGKIMSSLSTSLKNSYQRWLEPYEEYLRHAKPGVQAQLEFEYGGPLTPSPGQSPFKRPSLSHQPTPSSLVNKSPAIHATDALNASMQNSNDMKDIPMLDAPSCSNQPTPAPQAPSRSGFTPVNAGGFTPVNSAPGNFTPTNTKREREREPERNFTPPWHAAPASSSKNTPDYRPSGLSGAPLSALPNGVSSAPASVKAARQASNDINGAKMEESGLDESDVGSSGRRSKRLKKDATAAAVSQKSFLRPLGTRKPGDPDYFAPGEKCEKCAIRDASGGVSQPKINLLLHCESCDNAYHMRCLDPPLSTSPEYDWNCPRCLVGDGTFGFEEGGTYSLQQFQQKAANFKEDYFKDRLPFDPVLNCPRPVTEDDIEREFWRLVASLEETVEVEYGADIHSTTHGSGFPTVEDKPDDPYASDPWNLNVTPMAEGSLFRNIKTDISGMTVPWLYVGMIFSTFCWHNEDHYAYSANFQHFGSTKTWYGIPADDAEKFENAMREAVPELFETQPDLLFQLVTLLTPEQLKKAGVRVYALDQRAGQFVITFPQAYHAGFNHGFNLNEAVNFAPKDWEPCGEMGVERLQQFRRQPCFSHDELLWTAAEGNVTVETAKWLKPALERMRDREMELRATFGQKHRETIPRPHACVLEAEHGNKVGAWNTGECDLENTIEAKGPREDDYSCEVCKAYSYLSMIKCDMTGNNMCLQHAWWEGCCDMDKDDRAKSIYHTIHVRRTDEEIENMVKKISELASRPDVWEEKVTHALECDEPDLKTLQTLLHEGERIPYDLPSLPVLKPYVECCNAWVEEAKAYLVRKQSRRKSEKKSKKASEADAAEEKKLRNPANVEMMIEKQERLNFQCPEIDQLRERSKAIEDFKADAAVALKQQHGLQTTPIVEELVDRGYSLHVDLREIAELEEVRERSRWNDQAHDSIDKALTLAEVGALIDKAEKLRIFPNTHQLLRHFQAQKQAGELWEAKAKELMANKDNIHYPQLEALANQAKSVNLPTTPETLAEMEEILNKHREAQRRITSLYQRSKDPDPSKRPKYTEVRDLTEALVELNSKPPGTIDLEKEQKRHEDWMRKGKKLFGKANAPLHILKTHMEYVLERNLDCFDIINDKPRQPAEPQSREPSPEEDSKGSHSWEDPRFREVFCICRRIEAGMMIECEHCHEWYHGKCLKIARGKVKEDEKYTCPICDWRVKIPRDAARPKLEDLIDWQSEIAQLPFQPEEESILTQIIDNAQDFRNHVAPFCNPITATSEEVGTMRFYLRKIEGAEILLVAETNFFRKMLHMWSQVAPDPPPVLEQSKSTRKPRPTKLMKLMAQHGVDRPEELPPALRTKQHAFKRKSSEPMQMQGQSIMGAGSRQNSLMPSQEYRPMNMQAQQRLMLGGPSIPVSRPGYEMPFTSRPPATSFGGMPMENGRFQDSPFYGLQGLQRPGNGQREFGMFPHDRWLGGNMGTQPTLGSVMSETFSPFSRGPQTGDARAEIERQRLVAQERREREERERERREQERGVDAMFTDLTNTDDVDSQSAIQSQNQTLTQPETQGEQQGANEKNEDVAMPDAGDVGSQGNSQGQGDFMAEMALYGDREPSGESPMRGAGTEYGSP